MIRRRILWHNIPARAWLWYHHIARPRRRHMHMNLTGRVWTCSCGGTYLKES